jgi:hypothetical protein
MKQTPDVYRGSTFSEVRDQVWSDPYTALPSYEITLASFYGGLRNLLLKACRRALTEKRDLVEPFQRLVHPLGVALAGTWKMTRPSPYTGLFRPGTEALILCRGSVLLYKTLQGQFRGFALAGKIFPTLDREERVETVDFFTIDVLAGTLARFFTEVELSNEPPLGFNSDVLKLFWVVTATFASFIIANFNPVFRPVTEVAEHGLAAGEAARSPHWMMVRGWGGSGRVDTPDFRDELRVEGYRDGQLVFDVFGADGKLPSGERDYQQLGEIVLTESVTSASTDHRLKFRHPVLPGQKVL